MPRKLQVKPHSIRVLDYSSTMSQYEIESLAAEATLAADKKRKREEQRNLPTKRKAS
jgi:hypothetical protein